MVVNVKISNISILKDNKGMCKGSQRPNAQANAIENFHKSNFGFICNDFITRVYCQAL